MKIILCPATALVIAVFSIHPLVWSISTAVRSIVGMANLISVQGDRIPADSRITGNTSMISIARGKQWVVLSLFLQSSTNTINDIKLKNEYIIGIVEIVYRWQSKVLFYKSVSTKRLERAATWNRMTARGFQQSQYSNSPGFKAYQHRWSSMNEGGCMSFLSVLDVTEVT